MDQKISSKIDNRLIYLYGRGLGSSVSTYMTIQAPTLFRGLILQNAFTSTPDYLHQQYPLTKYIPDKLILNKWNNKELISQIKTPILFVITTDPQHSFILKKSAKNATFTEIYNMESVKGLISKMK